MACTGAALFCLFLFLYILLYYDLLRYITIMVVELGRIREEAVVAMY